jgi:hypothetical protein
LNHESTQNLVASHSGLPCGRSLGALVAIHFLHDTDAPLSEVEVKTAGQKAVAGTAF